MVYLAAARYGRMNFVENFTSKTHELSMGDEVVVRTERGVEWGVLTSGVTEQDRDDIKGLGEILRRVTDDDRRILDHIQTVKQPAEKAFCNEKIRELALPMKLADVEHLFGGDKLIFYFLADGRVDFRQLVKQLARNYRTRIEMRQIGVRDEARLLADYEHCGRELCCRTFMNKLEPVAMRMAKLQKTTLDPSKISGHCGRLMYCLRFEDPVYAALKKRLPPKGALVRTSTVEGEVVDYDILKQSCVIETASGDRVTVAVDDIVKYQGKRPEGASAEAAAFPSGGGEADDARS
ncbi:MAG: regulatory iron-sulfur-containing complex subunit RicT [Planctomycetota bacterium]